MRSLQFVGAEKGLAMASSVYIEGEPPVVDGWFEKCREKLYDKWSIMTGHDGVRSGGWACEIYYGCRTCNEHLSLPCSLAREASEIGQFLKSPCYVDNPVTFLRFYLVLLSEFVGGLQDVAGMIGIKLEKPPKDVAVWCNKFAKHRLNILVQHHPTYLFADSSGDAWDAFKAALPNKRLVDRCGNRRRLALIDYDWLADDARAGDLAKANGEEQAIIVVPPLMQFLDSTLAYFRSFVDACLKNSELVKQFESRHFDRACY